MLLARTKLVWTEYWEDTRGSLMVESVLSLPLLFWVMAATYEFFEVHRYKSAREKATYTIADVMSRENASIGITSTYMDNALTLFDEITNDDATNQIRATLISYDAGNDVYVVNWSKVRGTGPLSELKTADVSNSHSTLPLLDNGEEVLLVESSSYYDPLFDVGLDDFNIDTRLFTAVRFAPQLCFEGECGPPS